MRIDEMRKTDISVIIYSGNETVNIRETIQSVQQQRAPGMTIEIMVVGSDALAEIQEETVLHGGIEVKCLFRVGESLPVLLREAVARTQGDYITFMKSGDQWESSAFCRVRPFIEKAEYDLLCSSTMHVTNGYAIASRLKTGARESYLAEDYNSLPKQMVGNFFNRKILKQGSFNSEIEDGSFGSAFLANTIGKRNKCCNLEDVIYLYKRVGDVLTDEKKAVTDNQYLNSFLKEGGAECVRQYYALLELKKHLDYVNQEEEIPDHAQNPSRQSFLQAVLQRIDAPVIDGTRTLIKQYKMYLYSLKWGESYLQDLQLQEEQVLYHGESIFNLAKRSNMRIIIMESRYNVLLIEGLDTFNLLGENWTVHITDNLKREYRPQYYPWPLSNKNGFGGDSLYQGRRFRFEIPLYGIRSLHFFVQDECTKKSIAVKPDFGVYAKLTRGVRSYYAKDNHIFIYKKDRLVVATNRRRNRIKFEMRTLKFLWKKREYGCIGIRLAYQVCHLFKRRPVWIIRDNEKRAKDSGAEFFKFYAEWENRDYAKAYFVLDKKCEDYARMKSYGKIVQPDSFRYKILHLLADKVIDSRGGITSRYIFHDKANYVKDLCQWDYIWLIHGIMIRNNASWTNKFLLNAKLFATCSQNEYESVIDPQNGYGYTTEEVRLTGLPRHDSLYANKEGKKILFLPTWRKHLAGDIKQGTSDRAYVRDFKNNEFYQFYNGLINHPRLLKIMEQYGYTGDFYLHPAFMKQCNDFTGNSFISVGKSPADTNKLIGECSLLITDYSSAQFEGVYLNTPVVYTQYDAQTFSGQHTGKEGYFKYERDGFGPVCYNLEESVDAICSYIENGCRNVEPYVTRGKKFFVHHDQNNSRRVCERILEIDGYYTDEYRQIKKIDMRIPEKSWSNMEYIYDEKKKEHGKIKSCLKGVKINDRTVKIAGKLFFQKPYHDLEKLVFALKIGDDSYPVDFTKRKDTNKYTEKAFFVTIPYKDVSLTKKSVPIVLQLQDETGTGYEKKLKCRMIKNVVALKEERHRKLYYSKPYILRGTGTTLFLRETNNSNVSFIMRETSRTDTSFEQKKIRLAYLLSKTPFCRHAKRSILCFEKFADKYEESASVLFEKIINEGNGNIFFVIDKNSIYYKDIPEKYHSTVIAKYSFRHYLYFFCARTFIATESMNHAVELNIANRYVTERINRGAFDYIFLQHGVMYMYSLENRSTFIKGKGFQRNAKVVVSSQTEAEHFIDYGQFEQSDLIVSGLPKFDRASRNPGADKILIMPTSRDFEYNVMRLTPEESTYYRFVKSIIERIPAELQGKVIFVAHPLIKEQMKGTDLEEFMPKEIAYDKVLRNVRLLITDYSSIAYDAFYRGSNVLFCWEHKDMCLDAMGYRLMLNEDNVFGDISKEFDDLAELVKKNYREQQQQLYIDRYRKIVAFSDNANTGRCYEYLKKNGYLDYPAKKKRITGAHIEGRMKKVYTGFPRIHTNLVITLEGKELVPDRDYRQYYLNNKRKGDNAFLILVGKGDFRGVQVRRFRICQSIHDYEIYGLKWSAERDCLDDSSVTVRGKKKYLTKDHDFYIQQAERMEDGRTVKVTVVGKGRYGGKKVCYIECT